MALIGTISGSFDSTGSFGSVFVTGEVTQSTVNEAIIGRVEAKSQIVAAGTTFSSFTSGTSGTSGATGGAGATGGTGSTGNTGATGGAGGPGGGGGTGNTGGAGATGGAGPDGPTAWENNDALSWTGQKQLQSAGNYNYNLSINNANDGLQCNSPQRPLILQNSAGTALFYFWHNGNTSSADLSDRRLKRNISPLSASLSQSAMDEIKKLDGKLHTFSMDLLPSGSNDAPAELKENQ